MYVDTDLLRMGAGFSQSAGTIAERGAQRFAATQVPAGAFGGFDAAHAFHAALRRAHEAQAAAMLGHRSSLTALADDADSAAAIFTKQDEASETALDSAAHELT
ncbi:DUF2563 family protein [Mycobacterium sp. B14F4]|uniref:DUF2563 family protein n=1 Tax=Mycobacterium sp. B14F4 TaxID=3153565 RepID=UPI00325F70FE